MNPVCYVTLKIQTSKYILYLFVSIQFSLIHVALNHNRSSHDIYRAGIIYRDQQFTPHITSGGKVLVRFEVTCRTDQDTKHCSGHTLTKTCLVGFCRRLTAIGVFMTSLHTECLTTEHNVMRGLLAAELLTIDCVYKSPDD